VIWEASGYATKAFNTFVTTPRAAVNTGRGLGLDEEFQPIAAPPPDAPDGDEPPPPQPPATDVEPSTETETKPMQDRNAEVDFHGQKRSSATQLSVTDPVARLYKKGKGREAKLCSMGHALKQNRNGLIVDAETTCADGRAER
jgi:hypothetical protein